MDATAAGLKSLVGVGGENLYRLIGVVLTNTFQIVALTITATYRGDDSPVFVSIAAVSLDLGQLHLVGWQLDRIRSVLGFHRELS